MIHINKHIPFSLYKLFSTRCAKSYSRTAYLDRITLIALIIIQCNDYKYIRTLCIRSSYNNKNYDLLMQKYLTDCLPYIYNPLEIINCAFHKRRTIDYINFGLDFFAVKIWLVRYNKWIDPSIPKRQYHLKRLITDVSTELQY